MAKTGVNLCDPHLPGHTQTVMPAAMIGRASHLQSRQQSCLVCCLLTAQLAGVTMKGLCCGGYHGPAPRMKSWTDQGQSAHQLGTWSALANSSRKVLRRSSSSRRSSSGFLTSSSLWCGAAGPTSPSSAAASSSPSSAASALNLDKGLCGDARQETPWPAQTAATRMEHLER